MRACHFLPKVPAEWHGESSSRRVMNGNFQGNCQGFKLMLRDLILLPSCRRRQRSPTTSNTTVTFRVPQYKYRVSTEGGQFVSNVSGEKPQLLSFRKCNEASAPA